MSDTSKYILLQRTNYLKLPRWPLLRRLPMATMAQIEAAVRPEAGIVSAYLHTMQAEFDSLKSALPKEANKVLDIGCGLAGIDIFIHRHYGAPKLYLLDKTGQSSDLHYGLESEASYYNSLALARSLLEKNGVRSDDIIEVDIDAAPFPEERFELVLSLLSWGFHYPVETYLKQVKEVLAPGGVLIIDVRKPSDGEKILRENFDKVYSLDFGDKKTSRLVCSH